jgi:hypothetical protein
MASRKSSITREECEIKEKNTTEKLDVIVSELKEMRRELKSALEWQNQFKGGLKAFGILIGLAGTIGGLIFGAIKIFEGRHG